jgi:hypothetical protein
MEDTNYEEGFPQYGTPSTATASAVATDLDTIETTARNQLPSDYQSLKFEKHRKEYAAAIDLYASIDSRTGSAKTEDLLACRHYAWIVRHTDTGLLRVVANSCKLRFCPVCAEAKRVTIKIAVANWMKTIKRPKFMTFTIKHSSEPLREQITRLYKAYRLFRQHKFLRKKQRGGIWFFQLKRSEKTQQWHPHLHVIVDMDYVNKIDIQTEWELLTGDSFIVDIRAVKDAQKVANYVSRYCSKPCDLSDFTPTDRNEVFNSLNGKRLCGRFGSGSACVFKQQRQPDFAKWEKICSWTDCVLNRPFETSLQAVIRCWCTGEPLDTATSQEVSKTYCPSSLIHKKIEELNTAKQLTFEDYK